jgi:hypothetical protein
VNFVTTLLDRLIEPFAQCLTPEAARRVADLRAEPSLQRRVDELAEMANRGTLGETERAEYDQYLAAFHFVTILQARARQLLSA